MILCQIDYKQVLKIFLYFCFIRTFHGYIIIELDNTCYLIWITCY